MAKRSNRSISEWLGIDDLDIAFAFETECSEILAVFEEEQEIARAQLAGLGAIGMMGGALPSGTAERW